MLTVPVGPAVPGVGPGGDSFWRLVVTRHGEEDGLLRSVRHPVASPALAELAS
jgi:hypothetical protein